MTSREQNGAAAGRAVTAHENSAVPGGSRVDARGVWSSQTCPTTY